MKMQMDGGRVGDREASRGFSTCRRAGSSWNRGNSAWNVAGKDAQRLRRKPGVMDFQGMNFNEDFESGNDFTASLTREEDSQTKATTDDPRVQLDVQKEGGVFRVNGSVETVVDPDTLYSIITDYDSNARVFKNVDKVEVEQRGDEKIVTQYLHWNFLMWSGNYNVQMRMRDDPQKRSISYELERPGFLKVFNGSWTVEPLSSEGTSETSKLVVDQRALPSFLPPSRLDMGASSYAQNIMSSQVKSLLTDLATEASEVKKNAQAAASP